jgi:hypothetical protein
LATRYGETAIFLGRIFEPELDEAREYEVGEEDRQRITDDDTLHPRRQQTPRGQEAGKPGRQEDEGHVDAQEALFEAVR